MSAVDIIFYEEFSNGAKNVCLQVCVMNLVCIGAEKVWLETVIISCDEFSIVLWQI